MPKYTIGVDFGSLSARAVLVDVSNGNVISSAVKDYPDGVIDDFLPNTNIELGIDWALQNANDYIECFIDTVKRTIADSGVDVNDIIGVSIDFTSCTVLPVKNDGTPLMNLPEFKNNPHAWVQNRP